jgi:hypothetical protein
VGESKAVRLPSHQPQMGLLIATSLDFRELLQSAPLFCSTSSSMLRCLTSPSNQQAKSWQTQLLQDKARAPINICLSKKELEKSGSYISSQALSLHQSEWFSNRIPSPQTHPHSSKHCPTHGAQPKTPSTSSSDLQLATRWQ